MKLSSLFLPFLLFSVGNSEKSECRAKFSEAIEAKGMSPDILKKLEPCLAEINKPMFERKMTPLHVAARKGKTEAIDQFLQLGSDIDARDANDLTPVLQAAIWGHELAVNLLLEKGADAAHRSKFGGNYADYLRMTSPFRSKKLPEDQTSSPLPYSTHTTHNLHAESQCLGKSALLIDENVVRPNRLASLLEKKSKDYDFFVSMVTKLTPRRLHTLFLESYARYKSNPPALKIATLKTTDSGNPVPFKMCGLFAKESIPKGSVIAEYTGEITTVADSAYPTYRVDDYPVTDSMKYRSDASMANHGFPNTNLVHLANGDGDKGLDGLPSRKLLIAINDIAAGEEIVWNYGSGYDVSDQLELRLKALKKFVRTLSWKDLIETFKLHDLTEISEAQALDVFEKISKFAYFFESPSAIQFAVKNKYLTKAHFDLFKKELTENFDSFGPVCRGALWGFLKATEGYFTSNAREL